MVVRYAPEYAIITQDTDADILYLLKIALEQDNFVVHAVSVLNETILEVLDKVKPHVLLVDYRLNDTLCRDICNLISNTYPNLPVIAMSCNANIRQESMEGGFSNYLNKPFDLERLY
jgi:DNA-binding NtrC family response regulator